MSEQLERRGTTSYVERNEGQWELVAVALKKLGLATLDGVRACRGKVIKNHKGSRDVLRLDVTDIHDRPRTFYLKRVWKSHKKEGLISLLRRGQVWSVSRREWENSKALVAAGLRTAGLIAMGEECGRLWEKFSYILTAQAAGTQTLEDFLKSCREPARRRGVLDALALEIRKMHDAGLASPDLFTRHIFVDEAPGTPMFCLIDMARLNRRHPLPAVLRARDLAALNITAPLHHVSAKERLRFLKRYSPSQDRTLMPLIRARMNHLLRRRKHREFARPVEPPQIAPNSYRSLRTSMSRVESSGERVRP